MNRLRNSIAFVGALSTTAFAGSLASAQDGSPQCQIPSINVCISPKKLVVRGGGCGDASCQSRDACASCLFHHRHCTHAPKTQAAGAMVATLAAPISLLAADAAVQQTAAVQSQPIQVVQQAQVFPATANISVSLDGLRAVHDMEVAMVQLAAHRAAQDAASKATNDALDRLRKSMGTNVGVCPTPKAADPDPRIDEIRETLRLTRILVEQHDKVLADLYADLLARKKVPNGSN